MPPIPLPTIHLDLSGMENLLAHFDREQLMVALQNGAMLGGEYARGIWIRVAQGLDIRHTGAYLRGLQSSDSVRQAGSSADPSSDVWEVIVDVVNTAQHASYVEDGHEAFHLPSRINWSGPRVKISKKGTPYLSIPFEHTAFATRSESDSGGYTTAAIKARMPEHITEQARALTYTHRLGVGPIHNAAGHFVAADRYAWGTRLRRRHTAPSFIMGGPGASAGGPHEPGYEEHRSSRQVGKNRDGTPMVNPAWQGSKYDGLFKAGSTGHTSYMTIRTITPNSKGWNIPAKQGLHVARSVASHLQSTTGLADTVTAGFRNHLTAQVAPEP